MPEVVDTCSLASPASVCRTKHLHLRCNVDFTRRALTGTAALTVQSQEDNLRSLVRWDARPVPASPWPPASCLSSAAASSQAHVPVCSAHPSVPLCSPHPLFCTSSLAHTHFSASSSPAPLALLLRLPTQLTCVHPFSHALRILKCLLPASPQTPSPVPGHILLPHPRCSPHSVLGFHFSTNPPTPIILVPSNYSSVASPFPPPGA